MEQGRRNDEVGRELLREIKPAVNCHADMRRHDSVLLYIVS